MFLITAGAAVVVALYRRNPFIRSHYLEPYSHISLLIYRATSNPDGIFELTRVVVEYDVLDCCSQFHFQEVVCEHREDKQCHDTLVTRCNSYL